MADPVHSPLREDLCKPGLRIERLSPWRACLCRSRWAPYTRGAFRIPLSQKYGWSISQVTGAFELAILVLGFAAFAGGLWMRQTGPRPVAATAAVLYGLGTVLAGTAHSLPMFYLTYGVIGGAGLGLGYIVPIATLVRWFPDKRGMITGIAVAGFGAGALVTAPIAEGLIASYGVSMALVILGPFISPS